MRIEVAYATTKRQVIIPLEVISPCTVKMAIEQSNILSQFPEMDLEKQQVGIFSKKVKMTDLLRENDRVEIYRSLFIDPKEARLRRMRKNT